jgi:molecular chaperone GrpE (heat shock protein)
MGGIDYFTENVETPNVPTSLDTSLVPETKCILEYKQCKTAIERFKHQKREKEINNREYCNNEFLEEQRAIQQEKHEKFKAELENAIYKLEQQKEQLKNRQLTFSILTIIDFILFLYIIYKHNLFRMK